MSEGVSKKDGSAGALPAGEGLLFICTANQIRSPFMHLVVEDGLRRRGRPSLRIESAGVDTRPGTPVDKEVRAELDRRDVFSSTFRSRQLEPEAVDRATLILTATRQHRDTVGTLVPTARNRLFTLMQLWRLLTVWEPVDSSIGSEPSSLADQANHNRGRSGGSVEADDVLDPVGKNRRIYRSVFAQMSPALDLLIGRLADDGAANDANNTHTADRKK